MKLTSSPLARSAELTVAMPIYNAGRFLRAAVMSIVKQTYTDWKLIIIDDGSTDSALETISDINDSRIVVYQDGFNKGLAVRLNEAIDIADGKYFARMDQDDISYPERFMKQIQAFKSNPQLDLVATRAVTISEDDQLLGTRPYALTHEEICSAPWRSFYLPHPTWMGKLEWFRKYRYAEPAPYFCEDQELLLRTYTQSTFATLNEILFAYRVRDAVNWVKQKRTRVAVLKMQIHRFYERKQAFFALLAVLVCVGRMMDDWLQSKSWSLGRQYANQAVRARWDEVMKDLHAR